MKFLTRKGKLYLGLIFILALIFGRGFYLLLALFCAYLFLYLRAINHGSIYFKTTVSTYTLRQMDTFDLFYTLNFQYHMPFLISIEFVPPYYIVPTSPKTTESFFARTRVVKNSIVLKGNRRGVYDVGSFTIFVSDPFGFIREKRKISDHKKIFVFPFLVPFEKLKIHLTDPLEGLKAKYQINKDYSYIAGARDYNPDDPVSMIHWKQTAHRGRLTVKEFDFSASKKVVGITDFVQKSMKFQDYASSILASICYYAYKFHLPFGVILNGATQMTSTIESNEYHLLEVFKILSTVEVLNSGDGVEFLRKTFELIPFGSEVFYVERDLNPSLMLTLLQLKVRLSRLNVVLLPDEAFVLPGEKPPVYYFKEMYFPEIIGRSSELLARDGIFIYPILGKDYASILEV